MSQWSTYVLYFLAIIFTSNILVVESIDIKVNTIADKVLPSVKRVLKEIGFDPLIVPPISDDLTLASINLTDGVITEATIFKRYKDVIVTIPFSLIPTIRINASLYFPEMHAKFNYSLSTFVYSDNGKLDAVISNITAHVILEFEVLALELANPVFKIDTLDNVAVTMTSNSYINWLQNIIADNAIPFYKDHIAEIAEKTVNGLAKLSVAIFNKRKFEFAYDAIVSAIKSFFGFE